MNKTTKKKNRLENILAKIWFDLVLAEYGEVCEVCGERASQMHHFIPKSRSRLLRFEKKNGIPLCQKCHYIIHFSSKPSEIHRCVEKIRKGRGKAWCSWIDKKERESLAGTYGIHYLEELIIKLEQQK